MKRTKDFSAVNYKLNLAKILCLLCLVGVCALATGAQSTRVEYPTPVSSNEIEGKIPARDIGDSRLTSYYYTFNGNQGDIFINVTAANFNGDVDVFVAEGLRPLTKISFYADSSVSETGRVMYLRKPEKLILRVQGRTPDDNPATFKIKFAGSFVAVQDNGMAEEPKLPEVKTANTSGIRVNSVGTIIRPEPKPTPGSKERVAQNEVKDDGETQQTGKAAPKVLITDDLEAAKTDDSEKNEAKNEAEKKVAATTPKRKTPSRTSRGKTRTAPPPKAKPAPSNKTANKTVNKKADPAKVTETAAAAPKPPNPLENVNLIVLMKDGEKIQFPMTEVFRFSMNNGILTIITKDGKVHRRSILDVQKMTVE